MLRTSFGVMTVLACLVFAVGVADAKKKRKKKKAKVLAPISVAFVNHCKKDVEFHLDTLKVNLSAGATVPAQDIKARDDYSYTVLLSGTKAGDLGLVGLFPGETYSISLAKCSAGAANITTKNLSPRPENISPNAAPVVRFRAKRLANDRIPVMEYLSGPKGRFKKLSIGMTSYEEQMAGEFAFKLRYRASKRGPVLAMQAGKRKIEPGHRYLVEANVVGRKIFVKFEDEGWIEVK